MKSTGLKQLLMIGIIVVLAGCGSTGSMDDGQDGGDGGTTPAPQVFNFTGTVYSNSGAPFSGVAVNVFSPAYTTTTNTQGRFFINVSKEMHTFSTSRTGYVETFRLVDFSGGAAVDLPEVIFPSPRAAVNVIANSGTGSRPLTSNTVNDGFARLDIPAQESGRFNVGNTSVTNLDISLINVDLNDPLPVPMPTPNITDTAVMSGKQTPSVLIAIQPSTLNFTTPAILTVPNPDEFQNIDRVLHFDPERHQWVTISDISNSAISVNQGGIYGIFFTEPRSGAIRGTASEGSIVFAGDNRQNVGADGTFYFNEVPIPSDGVVNVLAIGPADEETGLRSSLQATAPLAPGGEAFVSLVQVSISQITLTADPQTVVADGVSTSAITAQVQADSGPVPDGTSVQFSTTAGKLSSLNAQTINGAATVQLISTTTSGVVATVTGTAGAFSNSVGVSFVPVPQSIALSTTQTTVKSDNSDSATITATVLNSNNAPYAGVPVRFEVNGGQLTAAAQLAEGEDFDPSSVITGSNGTAQVRFSSGAVDKSNKTVTVTASVGGLTPKTIPIQVVGTTLSIENEKNNLDTEGVSKDRLTITIQDAGLQPIYDAAVRVSAEPVNALDWNVLESKDNQGLITNVNGQIVLEVVGDSPATEAVLTIEGMGVTKTITYEVTTTSETFAIIDPALYVVDNEAIQEIRGQGVPEAVITNLLDIKDIRFIGIQSFDAALRSAIGETATNQYGDVIVRFALADESLFPWKTGQALPVKVRAPNQQRVMFSTTFGRWQGTANSKVINVTTVNGEATASLISSNAGVATIQALGFRLSTDDQPSASDSIRVAFAAPSADAAKISLQASATVVAPSVGDVKNTVTLRATVKTINDQVVMGAPVAFSLNRTTGGGESVSPVVVYTDSLGVASSTFTSGSLGSSAKGVEVIATVVGATALSDSIDIVIGGTAGSVVIGQSTVVESVSSDTIYELPLSVLVSDANGNPVPGAAVSLSVWPSRYATGYRDSIPPCEAIQIGLFDNEDINRNLICDNCLPCKNDNDLNEDKNGDCELTPPRTAAGSLPASVETDENGVKDFILRYLKESSAWIEAEITATTVVSGTETRSTLRFWLPEVEEDSCSLPHSPYNSSEVGSIELSAAPKVVTANGNTSTLTAKVKDPDGNPVTVGSIDFDLVSGAGSLSTRTALVFNGEATVVYTAPIGLPADPEVTIRASTLNSENELISDEETLTLTDVIVGSVLVTPGADAIMVSGLGGVEQAQIQATVTTLDGGFAPDGTDVLFSTTGGNMNPQSSETNNGVAVAMLTSSTTAGVATVTATALGVSGSADVTFQAGPPNQVTLAANPATVIAGATEPSQIRATVLDGNGNPVKDGTQVTFSAQSGTIEVLTGLTLSGVATTTYLPPSSPPTGGQDTIRANVIGVQGSTNIAVVGPQVADIVLTASPENIPINGATATIRATLSLVGGGDVPDGTQVEFSIKEFNGSNAAQVGTVTSPANTVAGSATAILTSGSLPGTVRVRAESGGIVKEIEIEYTSGSIVLEVSENTLLATGTEDPVEITATLLDENGLPNSGDDIRFSLDNVALGTLSADQGTTDANGRTTVEFTGKTTGGTATITAVWDENPKVKSSIQITISAPPAFIELAQDTVDQDGVPVLVYPNPSAINIRGTGGQSTSQIAFDVKDAQGSPVADGYRIDFSILSGPNGGEELSVPFATTQTVQDADGVDHPGRVVVILRSGFKAGPVSVKAVYYHNSNVSTTSSQIAIVAGPPVGHALGIAAEQLNIPGLRTSGLEDPITVSAADVWGNAVPNNTIISFKTYGTGGFFNPGTAVTSGGFATNSLFSGGTVPVQGFVFVTAETVGGPSTHVTSMAIFRETPNNQIIYVGTDGGGVYKSLNSGATWESVSRSTSPDRYAQNAIDPYVKGHSGISVDPDNKQHVYVGTGYLGQGNVFRSLDGGMNWNSDHAEEWNGIFSTNSAVLTLLADGNGSDYLWIGTEANGFWYTPNPDSFLFYPAESGLTIGKAVQDIVKVAGNGDYAVLYAASRTGVFKSTDGGRHWTENAAKSFIGDFITVLEVHPNSDGGNRDILYVGTEDSAIWVSTDSGLNWAQFKAGLGKGLSASLPKPNKTNIGTGILRDVEVLTAAKSENWTVQCIQEQANGGIFTVVGSVSGAQPNYTAQTPPVTYSIPNILSFVIEPGVTDFKVGDRFTFSTTRDEGRKIKDLLVDAANNKLYTITYFEGPLEPHPVGNLYVHELQSNGDLIGAWIEASSGLPQFDPPDDTTLHPMYVLGIDNAENPRALFIGGAGVNLFKATSGIDVGDPDWFDSSTGLTNLIMARMPVLFTGSVGMTVTAEPSVGEVLAELGDDPLAVVPVTYTFYIQDLNGNPPITGSLLIQTRNSRTTTVKQWADTYVNQGTFYDLSNPLTDNPIQVVLGVSLLDEIEFTFTPGCNPPDDVIGCSGSEQTVTFNY